MWTARTTGDWLEGGKPPPITAVASACWADGLFRAHGTERPRHCYTLRCEILCLKVAAAYTCTRNQVYRCTLSLKNYRESSHKAREYTIVLFIWINTKLCLHAHSSRCNLRASPALTAAPMRITSVLSCAESWGFKTPHLNLEGSAGCVQPFMTRSADTKLKRLRNSATKTSHQMQEYWERTRIINHVGVQSGFKAWMLSR